MGNFEDSIREIVGAKAAMGYIRGAGLTADIVLEPIDKALNRSLDTIIVSSQIALVTVRDLALDEITPADSVAYKFNTEIEPAADAVPETQDAAPGADALESETKICPDCHIPKALTEFLMPSGRRIIRCKACQRIIWNRQAAEKKLKRQSVKAAPVQPIAEIIVADSAGALETAKGNVLALGKHAYKDQYGSIWFIAEVDKTLPEIRWTAWKRGDDGLSCVKSCIPDGSYTGYFAALDALDEFASIQRGWVMVEAPEAE